MDRAAFARGQVTQYIVNVGFTQATLHFMDGSDIRFEHTSRTNRWARASAPGTIAEEICKALQQFRLNAKHLQLFFDDGTDAEFI